MTNLIAPEIYRVASDQFKLLLEHITEDLHLHKNEDLVFMTYISLYGKYLYDATEKERMIDLFVQNLGSSEVVKTTLLSDEMTIHDKLFILFYLLKCRSVTKNQIKTAIVNIVHEYNIICGENFNKKEWLADLDIIYKI